MSAATSSDWVLHATEGGRLERLEAYFSGHGYTPHRHDTYAIGMTLAGVQRFRYQHDRCDSLPGTVLILHPDELHDGEAGTDAGFRYRMLYVAPALIQEILGGQPLPFLSGALSQDPRLVQAVQPLLRAMTLPIEPLAEDVALQALAQALATVAGQRPWRRQPDLTALARARSYLDDAPNTSVTLAQLAQMAGMDRWQLCREFRAVYGTSPYRYLTMRRLQRARTALLAGQPLADTALAAGFFDQSHFTRHFTAALGMTPGRWLQRQGRLIGQEQH